MKKGYKIKHYRSRIYNPIRGKIIKAAIGVLLAAALFTVGWLLYEPLMKKINDANKEIIENNPVEVPPEEKTPTVVLPEFLEKKTVAATVPVETLYSTEGYYRFLCDLPKDVTAVVLEMKTAGGEVTYRSKQTSVKNAETTASRAVDLKQRIGVARDLGFDVIARIYTFEDAAAPYHSADMAIRYETEDGVLWLDDSVDDGGKPWLNPYSNTAQKYVLDIVYDALDAGVDAILLDGLRFPGENGLNYAYFGTNLTASKNEILKQFAQRVYSAAVTSETDVLLAYDGYAVISGEDGIYGGSPTDFPCDGFSPVLDLKAFVGEKFPSFYFKKMPDDPMELCNAVYTALDFQTNVPLLPLFVTEDNPRETIRAMEEAFNLGSRVGSILTFDEVYFFGAPVTEPTEPQEEPPVPETPAVPEIPVTPQPQPEPEQPKPEKPEEPPAGEEDPQPGITDPEEGKIRLG